MSPQGFCSVCGRTFLVGERVRHYVSAEGRHEVCELCAERTEKLGWLPADQDGAEERLRTDAGRGAGILNKLFSRSEREAEEDQTPDPEPPPAPPARRSVLARRPAPPAPARRPRTFSEPDTERYDVEAEWSDESSPDRGAERPNPLRRLADLLSPSPRSPETTGGSSKPSESAPAPHQLSEATSDAPPPSTPPASLAPPSPPAQKKDAQPTLDTPPANDALPDPAGRGMRPRRLQPDLSPSTRFERAIVRFNAGDAGRTAAGLTRTLGAPSVSVGDLAGAEDVVRVTVAWELTWYQWGVDLGDELRPVFELARGYEVAEIDAAARQWNASAHDGRIVMVAPARRGAENGRPVGHR